MPKSQPYSKPKPKPPKQLPRLHLFPSLKKKKTPPLPAITFQASSSSLDGAPSFSPSSSHPLLADLANQKVHEEDPTSKHDDTMFNKEKLVLSPIPVRSVGRPPSKRKESKIDQVVKRLRAKKQVAKSTKNVPSQKGRKKGCTKSKNGKDANLQSSQQSEGNTYFEGHEVGSASYFPNEFQELQTNESATPIHIKSYVDILEGKKDVMDLLSADLN